MGKGRSYEVIEFRNKITSAILKNKEIVELLGFDANTDVEEILYKRIFPHEYIPDTLKEATKYINFDIETTLDPFNNVFNNITIQFFLLAHDGVLRTSKGLWYDRVACQLDDMFTESNLFGVGKIMLVGNGRYVPTKDIRGRVLTFTVKDFTNGKKYGK